MRKVLIIVCGIVFGLGALNPAWAQWSLDKLQKKAEGLIMGQAPLSNAEVIRGLKQALEVGTDNGVKIASRVNGYYKNPRLKIPFPKEADNVRVTMGRLGMQKQLDKFVLTLNRAAEEAAKKAAPIFIDAIKQMTIKDGFKILNGPNDAATKYLKRKTHRKLFYDFQPVVKKAINKVGVTKVWNPIITGYNQLPAIEKQNPNLDEYVTKKAIDGLFILIAKEEKKIRTNPAARVTELLKRVFADQS